MKKHGACYYITKIYDNFYTELGKYEQKLDEIRGKLDKAQQDDDFMEYPKIEHEALELLKQLWASNVMHNYKSYFAQMSINIIANKVSSWSKNLEDILSFPRAYCYSISLSKA